MYLIFDAGCLVLAGGSIFLAWRMSRENKQLRETVLRKNRELICAESEARAFEAAGKAADERAEKLGTALRESEEKAEMLKNERGALEKRLMEQHERAEHFREEAEKWKAMNYSAEGRIVREIANIFNYNGTGAGQEDVDG